MRRELFVHNFLLHFTVFLLGFTGILGRLITLPGDLLVWYRTAIAAASIGIFLLIMRKPVKVSLKDAGIMMGIGLVVAIHWITFFNSIKLANVSITLLCLSVTTFFVAILEPLIFKTKISWLELLLGAIIILSLFFILWGQLRSHAPAGEHAGDPVNLSAGIIVGIISAILSGVFTILNRKATEKYDGFVLSFYEMAGGFIGISVYFLATGKKEALQPLIWQDWMWLLILGIICTGFAFWAILFTLKKMSAYTVVLAINMEPVYGFVMAALLFGENQFLGSGFYAGSFIIISSIFGYSFLKNLNKQKNSPLIKKR